jgi:lysophospholipase L1-like esterase
VDGFSNQTVRQVVRVSDGGPSVRIRLSNVYGTALLRVSGATEPGRRAAPVPALATVWIRTSGAYDAVIDLDRIMADPADADLIRPAYDSGDHLHPNDTGYHAMAEAVDLRQL